MLLILFSTVFVMTTSFFYIKSKKLGISNILLIAATSRYILCIIGTQITLPFGEGDGLAFERVAWELSQKTIWEIIASIDVTQSYLISSIYAIFYNILERNLIIPIFINGIIGILIFYFSIRLTDLVWGDRRVNRIVAVVVALHPILNVHSAIMLRENFICLFLILSSIHLVKYIKFKNSNSIFFFILFGLLASFFHGAVILFLLGFPLVLLFNNSKINLRKKVALGVLFFIAISVIFSNLQFNKLRYMQSGIESDFFSDLEDRRREANTAYLSGLRPNTPLDLLWQAPIRVFYLLTKPFPWDINSLGKIIILFDAMLWWFILWLIFRNWSEIKANPGASALLFCSLILVLAFAYGTGNYGTGVRHRTKFLVLALVIVAPFLIKYKKI